MNTVKSFWAGWGALCAAGGGAYYFAKRSINADRQARLEESRKKRQVVNSLEHSNNVPAQPYSAATMGGSAQNGTGTPRTDPSGSPSQEASGDPAPTRHAPATEGQRVLEKSKYESSVPYTSPKGDRFS